MLVYEQCIDERIVSELGQKGEIVLQHAAVDDVFYPVPDHFPEFHFVLKHCVPPHGFCDGAH
ncbi:hypothetical protein [Denitrovibrio acetiphilus]|uniref:hypothetical protein n=1 Tax=Denitrovibrio acetiphilus TaxID=118000 RepID=UPI00145E8104|nr:hypothetical protein [Denitrovibrio acetiphilus]